MSGSGTKKEISVYESGSRSGAWVKLRVNRRQDFLVGGYMRGLKPCLVVAIDFLEWTADNRLRHATLKRIFFTSHSPRHILSRTGELCTSKHLTGAGKNLQSRAKRYALNEDPHLNPLPCRERGNRYSIFEPPAVPLVEPAP